VPRWSSRVSALPPRAMTAISLMYGSHCLGAGGVRPVQMEQHSRRACRIVDIE
jgi:hypothetical protein